MGEVAPAFPVCLTPGSWTMRHAIFGLLVGLGTAIGAVVLGFLCVLLAGGTAGFELLAFLVRLSPIFLLVFGVVAGFWSRRREANDGRLSRSLRKARRRHSARVGME